MSRIVIIPTYNEKENIQPMLKAVMELDNDFHVLIVQDEALVWIEGQFPDAERCVYNIKNGIVLAEECRYQHVERSSR